MCAAGTDDYCPDFGFQMSGKADNWPLGTGALVSQQTTHRGESHTDPAAPHRVVFILTFAPRPQTLPQTVETRMIGFQGSYSLHWSQWGHTLRDFQHPLTHMTQPWRTLRSLGLYKPANKQWGWDYVTVSSCRIANEDTGFSVDDLLEFVKKGGFFWLPKRLHGGTFEEEESEAWVYFLQDTVKKCREAFELLHRSVLAVCGIGVLLFALAFRGGRRVSTIARNGIRLFVLHAAALLLARWTFQHVLNSTWGRNIRFHRSFSLPETLALAPRLPATLPTIQDVLILEGMQSEYLGSFTQVLEVAHPGNKSWHEIVGRYASGYSTMSPNLQQDIRFCVLRDARLEQRRILIKNKYANWAEVTPQHADWFCHKSLLQRSNRYVNAAVQRLDFSLTEARVGYWRDTVLHRRFVSKLLTVFQDNILGLRRDKGRELSLSSIPIAGTWSKQSFRALQSSLPALPASSIDLQLRRQRSGIPLPAAATEPSPRAWLNEGDLVEAAFEGNTNGM